MDDLFRLLNDYKTGCVFSNLIVFLFHFADDLVILSSCSAVCNSCWVNAASILEFSGNSIITTHKTMYWKTYSCDHIFKSEYGFAVK